MANWSRHCLIMSYFRISFIRHTAEKVELVDSKIIPYAQQVICAGLRDMTEQDFLDFSNIAVENAIGFRWGYNVRCTLPNVWIGPQIRMEDFDDKGIRKRGLLDFLFIGRLNLGIELILNSTDGTLKSHLNRFDAAYKAIRGNGFVFDIQTRKDTISEDVDDRVYTFLKTRNELYRGNKMIQRNVVANSIRNLPPKSGTEETIPLLPLIFFGRCSRRIRRRLS